MPKNTNDGSSVRGATISAVKTYLGFYVFLALVVEATLGALAFRAAARNQLVIIYGMIFIFLALLTIVSLFVYKHPDRLLQTIASQQALLVFGESIKGCWWQKLTPDEPVALSFVEITPCTTTNSAELNGSAYSRGGNLVTYWKTETSFMDATGKTLLYYWERDTSSPEYKPYEGFGKIIFKEPVGQSRVHGFFLDIIFPDMTSTKKYSTEYWRCENEDEKRIIQGRNENLIRELIKKKLENGG